MLFSTLGLSRMARGSGSLHSAVVRSSRTSAVARRSMGGDGSSQHMPVPQSQVAKLWEGHKVEKEGWEETVYFYYTAALLLHVVVYMAPDTSIESWARAEAQARLKLASEGFTEFEFGKHYQDLEKNASLEVWNKFADRSTVPGDDDDDEDEDDEDEEDDE